jgi:dihydrofolate reductase
MGASTYEWMLRHVVKLGAADAAPWPYSQPAWVFYHRRLPLVPGGEIRLVEGDVQPVRAQMRLAAGTRNVWLVGGGELVAQFHDAGLLDELVVQVGSVTLGSGRPLLPRLIAFLPLRLISAQRIGDGFAELRYEVPRPAGSALTAPA